VKILHIISSSGMYGAEAVILNLCRELNGNGHESILGVFKHVDQTENQFFDAAVAAGLEVHLIPCRGQIDVSAVRAILDLTRRSGADVLHAHGYKADIYTWLALRRSKIPTISTCHNWLDTDLATRMYGRIDRFALRHFSRVVAVSGNVEERLLSSGISKDKVQIIRNGVDVAAFKCRTEDTAATGTTLAVGLAGRLSREKGVDVFLKAAAIVQRDFPSVRFVIAGEGPERESLEALIDELGLPACVSMPGRCDDMPTFYASLDVLVSASRTEGLPMGLLEGMASCLPIVATNVGDVSTIVRSGETGFLVPPEDSGPLGQAILKLLLDAPLREHFGSTAQKFVAREFSAERMATRYLSVYEAALSKDGC